MTWAEQVIARQQGFDDAAIFLIPSYAFLNSMDVLQY